MTPSSIDFESILKFIIQFQSRCMSVPTLSDIDFKNKMIWVWTTLKNNFFLWSARKLKSMSERGGSDIEQLWNWISRSTQNLLKMASFEESFQSRSISDSPLSDIHFKNKMTFVRTTLFWKPLFKFTIWSFLSRRFKR